MDLKISMNMHCKQAAIHIADVVSTVEHSVIAAFAAESSRPSLFLQVESANTDSRKTKSIVCGHMSVYHHFQLALPQISTVTD